MPLYPAVLPNSSLAQAPAMTAKGNPTTATATISDMTVNQSVVMLNYYGRTLAITLAQI